ncbi:MAG TPA: hypothetical protein DEB10_02490 [Ruminococcaceae bacterium]|nr:hypothetical protein [Oscillospiraceae bacterium]
MSPSNFNCPFFNQYQNMMYPVQPLWDDQQYTSQELPVLGHPIQSTNKTEDALETVSNQIIPTQTAADPPPILSNNPAVASILLHKELTGYPNYGNPSRNADILYTGNTGTCTFESPAFLFVPGNLRPQIVIRAVLDDHSNVPVNRYSLRITVNGSVVHNGRVQLEHGVPAGGMFTNWRELTFNVPNLRRVTQVVIQNTSNAGPNDWIGLDWMQLRLLPRTGGRLPIL